MGCLAQFFFKHLQDSDSPTLPDIVPRSDHLFCDQILSNVQTKPSLAQPEAMSSHPVASRYCIKPTRQSRPQRWIWLEATAATFPRHPWRDTTPSLSARIRDYPVVPSGNVLPSGNSPPRRPRPHLMPGPTRRARASSPLRRAGRGREVTTPTTLRPSISPQRGGHGPAPRLCPRPSRGHTRCWPRPRRSPQRRSAGAGGDGGGAALGVRPGPAPARPRLVPVRPRAAGGGRRGGGG